jgi:signal transduction histidine kinase/DNA-binding response OmpR family regulator
MTKHSKPLLFGFVLATILSLLYWNTRTEGREYYLRMGDRLRDIQRIDAVLNQDILKSCSRALGDYDSLNRGLTDLRESGRSLLRDAPVGGDIGVDLRAALDELLATLDEKEQLVEEFASRNAVIKNSIDYLPIAAADMAETDQKGGDGRVSEIANAFLGEILLYTLTGDSGQIARLEERIEALRRIAGGLPPNRRDRLSLLADHARMIVRQKRQVDSVVARLLAVPIPRRGTDLQEIYQRAHDRDLERAGIVQAGLYLFSIVLVMVMVNVMRQLRAGTIEVNRANENLERRVRDRTEALFQNNQALVQEVAERKRTEDHLNHAIAAADSANRAKGEFLANMSHEIRTPMNGIIGMTALALANDLTPETRTYLGMVKSSADSLMAIINDILDFSKIEAGKLTLDPQPFRIRDVLPDALEPLAALAHSKGVELVCRVDPSVPNSMVGDFGRLRQIVFNLAGNALKFTEKGEVVVRVVAGTARTGEVELGIAVCDTGIGIRADRLAAIFESFTQADGSTTRKYGGTGLGLTISRRLAELMGGRLWAVSELGKGSTFYLTANLGIGSSLALSPPPFWAKGLRVLVVDPNATTRGVLEEMLGQWRMRPAVAGSQGDALGELLRAAESGEPFSVLLLEGSLTGSDVIGLLERMRSLPALAETVVILLATVGHLEPFRWRGQAVSMVAKPVRPSNLLEAIGRETSLGRRGSSERPPARPEAPAARSLRLLLAEDNPINQKVAVRLLERQGHTVTVAGNGRIALDALGRGDFDAALFDVQMPEMDGLEAVAELRRREEGTGRRLPVIALTAHAMKGDRERCLAAGMDVYLTKPIRIEEIRQALAALLPSAHEAGDAVEPQPVQRLSIAGQPLARRR